MVRKFIVNGTRKQEIQLTVSDERWQGKLIKKRWNDDKVKLDKSFAKVEPWYSQGES